MSERTDPVTAAVTAAAAGAVTGAAGADAAAMRAAVGQITAAVDLVKHLLATGAFTADALGLVLPAPGPGAGARGPGERITVAALTVKALDSCSPNTARTYGSYLRLLANGDPSVLGPGGAPYTGIGAMWADQVLPSHLHAALEVVRTRQVRDAAIRAQRREDAGRVVRDTDGRGALYNAVGAWRCLFAVAIAERALSRGFNPAMDMKKPKRARGTREALEHTELAQLLELFASTGDDPELDTMVCRFILVTGARQEGLLNLRLGGIDLAECTVRLDEKFGKKVHQPVPDWFAAELHDFARSRGAAQLNDPVFVKRTSAGKFEPIGPRRFNYLFTDRLQAAYLWADKRQVTAHTLRHHAITVIERATSTAISVAFARHAPEGTNGIYTTATPKEVAQAVVRVHGGDHPWLHRPGPPQ